jgi:hypothetical protein
MGIISLEGIYDLHVHTGPEPFARSGDALDIARWCAAEGMAGFVPKGHFESTVARAHHANKELGAYPNFKAFGAIALNRGVGGVNPAAVEIALESGAKVVWLPTLDATNHARAFGSGGTYGFQAMSLKFRRPSRHAQTYSVLDSNGALTAEAKEVIEIVAAYEAILATGHISPAEIEAVVSYANEIKLARVVVTHPEFTVPDLDVPTMISLAKRGVFMEFCAANCFPLIARFTVDEMIEMIEAVGPECCIISSDAGQPFHPRPPETLRSFLQLIHERGVSERTIRKMCAENPAFLVNAPGSSRSFRPQETSVRESRPQGNPFGRAARKPQAAE